MKKDSGCAALWLVPVAAPALFVAWLFKKVTKRDLPIWLVFVLIFGTLFAFIAIMDAT